MTVDCFYGEKSSPAVPTLYCTSVVCTERAAGCCTALLTDHEADVYRVITGCC